MVAVPAASVTERLLRDLTTLAGQLGGLALFSGIVAIMAAFLYRWYVRDEIPVGLAILLGVSAIATALNTTDILGPLLVGEESEVVQIQVAMKNIAAFAAGLLGAILGRGVGDGFGRDVFDATTFAEVDEEVSRLVKAVGRVVTVELPEEIDDVVGYDPVSTATKTELAGRTFLFPRGLTVGELGDRLVARLKTDYAVGHVDVELADDGTVEYLAVGSRAAGIGPTLPPATNATAICADPAFAASAGDLVQVWEPASTNRVLTAELRGAVDDVVTLAIDAADTPKLDPTTQYRLVTLPVEDRPDREFMSVLRAADETVASTTVEAGSALDGSPVGALAVTVLAIVPPESQPAVLPRADRVLAPGDVVHAIARPEALRHLESAAVADEDAQSPSDTSGVARATGDHTEASGGPSNGTGPATRTAVDEATAGDPDASQTDASVDAAGSAGDDRPAEDPSTDTDAGAPAGARNDDVSGHDTDEEADAVGDAGDEAPAESADEESPAEDRQDGRRDE